jgi:hypothetical protein
MGNFWLENSPLLDFWIEKLETFKFLVEKLIWPNFEFAIRKRLIFDWENGL